MPTFYGAYNKNNVTGKPLSISFGQNSFSADQGNLNDEELKESQSDLSPHNNTVQSKDPSSTKATNGGSIGSELKKQGAYGKLKTHSESVLSQLIRLDEVFFALQVKYFPPFDNFLADGSPLMKNSDIVFCKEILNKVSRSFAAVILQLPEGLCIEIMIF